MIERHDIKVTAMIKSYCFALLALSANLAYADNTVSVEKLPDRNYRVTLTSTKALDPGDAQSLLWPTAVSLCEGYQPKFGYYRFESTEPITGSSSTSAAETFELVQDVECVSVSSDAEAEADIKSFLTDSHDRSAIETRVRALSETYFTEIFGGKYEEAYARKSESVRSFTTFDEWVAQMDRLRDEAGDIDDLNIHTITIDDNPPDAPEPGLYVAADYQNGFARAPYHCGYLMWFRSEGIDFELIREESGLITNVMLMQVPEEELPNLMAHFRCRAR
jgi:hypothetical protein